MTKRSNMPKRNDSVVTLSLDDINFRTVHSRLEGEPEPSENRRNDLECGEPDNLSQSIRSAKPCGNASRKQRKRTDFKFMFCAIFALLVVVAVGGLYLYICCFMELDSSTDSSESPEEPMDAIEPLEASIYEEPESEPEDAEPNVSVEEPANIVNNVNIIVIQPEVDSESPAETEEHVFDSGPPYQGFLDVTKMINRRVELGHVYVVHHDKAPPTYHWSENIGERSLYIENMVFSFRLMVDKYIGDYDGHHELETLFRGLKEAYYLASKPNRWSAYSRSSIEPKHSQKEIESMFKKHFKRWLSKSKNRTKEVRQALRTICQTFGRQMSFIMRLRLKSASWRLEKGCFGCFKAPERPDLDSAEEVSNETMIENFYHSAPVREQKFLNWKLGHMSEADLDEEHPMFDELQRLTETYDECPSENPFWDELFLGLLDPQGEGSKIKTSGQVRFRQLIRDALVRRYEDKITGKDEIKGRLASLKEIYSNLKAGGAVSAQQWQNFSKSYDECYQLVDETWGFCCNWVSQRSEKFTSFIDEIEGTTFQ